MDCIVFDINHSSIKHLTSVDHKLGSIIRIVGDYSLELKQDYFASLVRIIIGQQLSVKAARSIWTKLYSVCDGISPIRILSAKDIELRNCGLSRSKIIYIKGISQKILNKEIVLEKLSFLNNKEAHATLTALKGVGDWSSDMFLIFSLGRLNVLSVSDVGLRRAVKLAYEMNNVPPIQKMHELGGVWHPYQTVASLYLWAYLDKKFAAKG